MKLKVKRKMTGWKLYLLFATAALSTLAVLGTLLAKCSPDKRHRSQIEKRHNPAKDSQPRCPEGPCLK